MLADVRLVQLFEADQRYVRRRRLRRRAQTMSVMTFPVPVAAIAWQGLVPPVLSSITLIFWATLFMTTHLLVVSEWLCSRQIVEAADELVCGRRPTVGVDSDLFGTLVPTRSRGLEGS